MQKTTSQRSGFEIMREDELKILQNEYRNLVEVPDRFRKFGRYTIIIGRNYQGSYLVVSEH